jgi:glycosyltransferase involved in cell wall biosynthesis
MTGYPIVNILLSTFNGISFLREQLDSLQAQDYPNVLIYIRDDGSTDGTSDFLQNYQKQFPTVKLITGENIGYKRSFLELALNAKTGDGEFYAFCDQDDVWSSQKISRAMKLLQQSPKPEMTLCFCRMNFVDSQLQLLGQSSIPRYLDFGNALAECTPSGCTMVFGSEIYNLFIQGDANKMFGHDWWVYLVASAFGYVVYDPQPHIQFREHSSNTSTAHKMGTSLSMRIKFRIKDFLQRLFQDKPIVDFLIQAEMFMTTYETLSDEKRLMIEKLFQLRMSNNVLLRLRCVFNSRIHFNDPFDDLVLQLLILIGHH